MFACTGQPGSGELRGLLDCVDGCSGAGKSSLVITLLLKHNIQYTTVQVTRSMNWQGFCRQVISKHRNARAEVKAGVTAGSFEALFPTGRLYLEFARKRDDKSDLETWEKLVSSASEHDVARAMSEQDSIVIDDFERAQPALANSISEVCKILSQTHTSPFAKVVVLGADDVYKKLYDVYSTLDNRLVQISIPTLPSPRESWGYLQQGSRKLEKFHPGNSRYSNDDDRKDSMEAIYYAADGLFKTLTELGIEICRAAGPDVRGISKRTILSACRAMEEKISRNINRNFQNCIG